MHKIDFARKKFSNLKQDIEHDGRAIQNPKDPPGQHSAYIPPGKMHSIATT